MTKNSTVNAADLSGAATRSSESGRLMIRTETLAVPTEARVELIDVTDQLTGLVRASGVRDGLVSLWSMHTTFAVFMNESQLALHADIKRLLEQIVDRDADWMHNDPAHSDCDRLNADAHLRAMLLGHSLSLQVGGGQLVLGQWQRILVGELDGPRARTLRVQILGIGEVGA